MSPYALLGLSVLFEVFGDTCMKLSEGFTQPVFGIVTAACYILSFAMLTFALKDLSLGDGLRHLGWRGHVFDDAHRHHLLERPVLYRRRYRDDRGRRRHRAAQQGDARGRGG